MMHLILMMLLMMMFLFYGSSLHWLHTDICLLVCGENGEMQLECNDPSQVICLEPYSYKHLKLSGNEFVHCLLKH